MTVSKRDVIRSLGQRKVAVMLMLGFSSGLPFFLTGNTLGYWMRDEGTTLAAIGFLSWVGLAYSFKFLWAPIVDRTDMPGLEWLGRRRGWMLLTQLLVGVFLAAMAAIGRSAGLAALGALALVVAFSSSTQDIVVDAWRIEVAADPDELGLLSAAYQFGYRIAILVGEAAILFIANHFGWNLSYGVMAMLMGIGIVATLLAAEPARAKQAFAAKAEMTLWTPRGFADAVIGPFREFFRMYGWLAVLMLAMISFYQLPEYMTGPMYNPFYHDLGLSKDAVGGVRASIGLVSTLVGITAGGFCALRFGYMPALIAGVILKAIVIANFATLAHAGPSIRVFSGVIFADNFGIGFAGVALVTYMSSLTSLGYTATQYALLSSAYTYLGKFAKGWSGVWVEHLAASRSLLDAYGLFFVSAGLLHLPALLLCILLARATRATRSSTAPQRAAL
ncbi:MAG TPA: MFS transporter [Vicinamibacterales bacterium]|nr:MFS transporter [Vicinamibacterales bacterium]